MPRAVADNRHPSPTPARKRLILLLLCVGPPALLIAGLELAGRAYVAVKYGVPGKSYGLWRGDRKLGAIHAENAYNSNAETNALGFRNKEDVLEPKPAGSLRLVAYGGSTTFCYNLLNDQTWALRLQGILRQAHHPRDQVMNGGAILWSVSHDFARAQDDLPRLRPDFVILYAGINEEWNARSLALQGVDLEAHLDRGELGLFATNLDQCRWLKRNSMIVRYYDYVVADFLRRRRAPEPEVGRGPVAADRAPAKANAIVLEHYLRTLRAFITLIKANGAKPIFVIQAYRPSPHGPPAVLEYSRRGAAVARAEGSIVVDAQQVADRYQGNPSDLFYQTGVHWSELGARLLARHIYEQGLAPYLAAEHRQPVEPSGSSRHPAASSRVSTSD